jgi:glutathione S-transferase
VRFYDCATAPSPRRVRVFLAEKGISVPTVQVNLRDGEQFTPSFRAINPDCTVPVLELDNGARITDAIGICRYFEAVQLEPALFGTGAEEIATIESWQRRAERDGFYAVMEAFRNSTPGLKGRALPGPLDLEQIPALAERGRARVQQFFDTLNARVSQAEYVAGPRYSVADITAMIAVEFAGWLRPKLPPPDQYPDLGRWFAAVSGRPSAKA